MNFNDNAYIYLRKKILNWEWFTDVNTAHFFIYCLLKANWESGSWKGIDFERGEFIASLETIVNETGLTVQNIRTAIKHLISTQELTTKQHGKYRIFTVVKYDCYQQPNTKPNNEVTRNQQESNTKVTTDNKRNKEKEEKESNKDLINPPLSPLGETGEKAPKKNSLTVAEAQEQINKMIDDSELSAELKIKLKEFVAYKRTIRDGYKSPAHFNSKIKDALTCEKQYGTYATIKCIDDCMGNGYKGVFYSKAYQYAKEKPKESFNVESFLRRFD